MSGGIIMLDSREAIILYVFLLVGDPTEFWISRFSEDGMLYRWMVDA